MSSRIITTVKNTEECCSKVCSDDKYLILATLKPTYRELFEWMPGVSADHVPEHERRGIGSIYDDCGFMRFFLSGVDIP